MKVDGDTIVLDETEVAECIVHDLARRKLLATDRPYYVRFRLDPSPLVVLALADGSRPHVVVSVEPREHS